MKRVSGGGAEVRLLSGSSLVKLRKATGMIGRRSHVQGCGDQRANAVCARQKVKREQLQLRARLEDVLPLLHRLGSERERRCAVALGDEISSLLRVRLEKRELERLHELGSVSRRRDGREKNYQSRPRRSVGVKKCESRPLWREAPR